MSDPVEAVFEKVQPPQGPGYSYSPSRITLYGMPLLNVEAHVGLNTSKINLRTFAVVPAGATLYIVALIYGYAYQGHCYNLPEPIALLVPHTAEVEGPAIGCNFSPVAPFNYRMWQVEKLEMTVQIQMSNDTFEELILRRNLAGMKPPLSYHSAAALSHRGGKLSDQG